VFSSTYLVTAPVDTLPRSREQVHHPSVRTEKHVSTDSSLSSQEEQALVERLRGLGYIE
jgi:hypothetical protein